jgi:hypothetical protein
VGKLVAIHPLGLDCWYGSNYSTQRSHTSDNKKALLKPAVASNRQYTQKNMSELQTVKANLGQSMALGGAAAAFAVNFTHPIVSIHAHCGALYCMALLIQL